MKLYIIGAGKYGKEIEDVAEQMKCYEAIYFLDDNALGVVGKCRDFVQFVSEDSVFYVAFGNNELRAKWLDEIKRVKGNLATIIHPSAYISPKAKVGLGVAILPKAIVNTYSSIHDGVMVNSGAIVDHDCEIGACAHICVGAIVKADNKIPEGMKVEAGVVIERDTFK